jgi:type IV secretory pathway VirB10-like protein
MPSQLAGSSVDRKTGILAEVNTNMNPKPWIARFLIAVVGFALCGAPQLAQAQSAAQPPQPTQPSATQPNGGMNDPSAPLAPAPLPDAPSSSQTEANAPAPPPQEQPAQQPQTKTEQPLGAAVGQVGVTSGGAASKPAGNAIAPAKQHQTRSLLIKIGAIGAAGVAIGTVLALSKASPSQPPK